jgi:hypothetical protein
MVFLKLYSCTEKMYKRKPFTGNAFSVFYVYVLALFV